MRSAAGFLPEPGLHPEIPWIGYPGVDAIAGQPERGGIDIAI